MYHAVVRRLVRRSFDALSRGDYAVALNGVAGDVHHVFAGDHPLGGERHTEAGLRRWFERLYRLFPRLEFDTKTIMVEGWPWNVRVAAEWVARVTPQEGEPYMNRGVHLIRIQRGRVTAIHAYEDSQRVAEACREMAARGVEEAAAPPITG